MLDVNGQVRVRQRGEHARLAFGELDVFPAFGAAYLEALDGDRAAVQLVDGIEGLGMRARAELPEDRVATRAQRARNGSRAHGRSLVPAPAFRHPGPELGDFSRYFACLGRSRSGSCP